uniref:Histone-lysine N-methyltransferase SETD2-like n=1 Tax=Lepisosteus oculatus TaxID=7918 RepID=W5LWU8_LEPOC
MTKKPLQNRFLAPLSPEKPASDSQISVLTSVAVSAPTQDKVGQHPESRSEQIEPLSLVAESITPSPFVPSPLKPKLDLGKMHFKKQLLSVTAKLESTGEKEEPLLVPSMAVGAPSEAELQVELKTAAKAETESQTPNAVEHSTLEDSVKEKPGLCQQSPGNTSHIGKEENDTEGLKNVQCTETSDPRKNQPQLENTLPGSESDGDSVRTSSSHKSGDIKSSTAHAESRSKEVKRNSSVSKGEESEKSSYSRTRSEKDDRHSSYSKSDRESRHTSLRSSRSERQRRRSRSRTRSRSRGSRKSSSYSRSERSLRSERSTRSERSHYHDSDRRSHRSTPHRERSCSSRSRTDIRSRDSSESEDDHRRTRSRGSDSKRSSTNSISHRESKTTTTSSSYSKSEKDCKTTEPSHSSETEKKMQSNSRSERDSRRNVDLESIRKTSPEMELDRRKSNAGSKLESSVNSTHSKPRTRSQTSEKASQKMTSSSESEEEQEKSQLHSSETSSSASGSDERQTTSASKMDKPDVKRSSSPKPTDLQKPTTETNKCVQETERQSMGKSSSPKTVTLQSDTNKLCSQTEDGGGMKESCPTNNSQCNEMDSKQCCHDATPYLKDFQNLTVPEPGLTDSSLAQDCKQSGPPDKIKSFIKIEKLSTYSLRSHSKVQKFDVAKELGDLPSPSMPDLQNVQALDTNKALTMYDDTDVDSREPKAQPSAESSQQEHPDCPGRDIDSSALPQSLVDNREETATASCEIPVDSCVTMVSCEQPSNLGSLCSSLDNVPLSNVSSTEISLEHRTGVLKTAEEDKTVINVERVCMEEDVEVTNDLPSHMTKSSPEGINVGKDIAVGNIQRLPELKQDNQHSQTSLEICTDEQLIQKESPLTNCSAFSKDEPSLCIEALYLRGCDSPTKSEIPNNADSPYSGLSHCNTSTYKLISSDREETGSLQSSTVSLEEGSFSKVDSCSVKDLNLTLNEFASSNVTEQKNAPISKPTKGNVKKSRWDIVGQETSDQETSPRRSRLETKPYIKKVVSVRRIHLSKDSNPDTKEICMKEEPIFKQECPVIVEHNLNEDHVNVAGLFSAAKVADVKTEETVDQADSSLVRQQKNISDIKSKPEPLNAPTQPFFEDDSDAFKNNEEEMVVGCSTVNDPHGTQLPLVANEEGLKKEEEEEDMVRQRQCLWKSKPDSSNMSLEREGEDSEDSETEESDLDSDDSGVPRNRLQSVVVVPKNSTLISIEGRAIITPSSSPSNSPGRPSSDWAEHSWTEPFGRGADRDGSGEGTRRDTSRSRSVSPERRRRGGPVKMSESCKRVHEVPTADTISFPQSTGYPSQSNMVDSTSQSEASRAHCSQHHTKPTQTHGQDKPKTLTTLGSVHDPQNSWGELDLGDSRHYERPDSWQGRKWGRRLPRYQPGDFTRADGFCNKDDYNLGWDYTQAEQPTSTYQQPDSSHGVHLDKTYQLQQQQQQQNPLQEVIPLTGQPWWQDNGYWAPPGPQSCRPVCPPMALQYRESVGQVHPDSLTNDYDDESRGKSGPSLTSLLDSSVSATAPCDPPPSAPSSFVQANEVSSNCRGPISAAPESSAISEAPREESCKPHRGRGPPKKRRPELESDSENEAEVGPSKKERLREGDNSGTSVALLETPSQIPEAVWPHLSLQDFLDPVTWKDRAKMGQMPPYFDLIEENLYLTERKKNKSHRDIKRMQCECAVLPKEERAQGAVACGEDCLNRLLMIECSSRCPNGGYCSNRRFQRKQHAEFEVILTDSKGWGLRAAKDLTPNTFVLEYCGEVLDHKEFKARVKEYARSKNIHYYFMALKNNEIIDATLKGNCSRFMNHSCEPNCETQKVCKERARLISFLTPFDFCLNWQIFSGGQ